MKKLVQLIQRPQLQLRWKLLIGFLATNLLLVVALALSFLTLFGTNEALANLKKSNERSQLLNRLEVNQIQLVNRALDYIWSNNLSRLNEYEIIETDLNRAFATFQPNALQEANFKALKQQNFALQVTVDQLLELNEQQREDEAKILWRTQGSKQAVRIRDTLAELSEQEAQNANLEYRDANNQINNSAWLIRILALLAVATAIGLALLLTAALIEPVQQLRARLANLAKGDLTQPVQITNRDELGDLGTTYNATLGSLRGLVKQLYSQSQQVSSATEELTMQARTQVAGSSQQYSSIVEATQALKELSRTADEIARQANAVTEGVESSLLGAETVSHLADEMVKAHEQGRRTVAKTVDSLQALKQQVAAIEEQQRLLTDKALVIRQIISLIDGIAKETHLLALNASIEAAGAGVYGSRFAVIAEEVKHLSDRSVAATKQVRGALGSVTLAIEEATRLIGDGLHEAEKAVEEAGHSDATLVALANLSEEVKFASYDIVMQVKDTNQLATNIHVATRQQQVASTQMLEKMLEIETVTTQTLSSIKQGEAATQVLSLSARALENSADAFKVAA